MVYVPSDVNGWRPFASSWLDSLMQQLCNKFNGISISASSTNAQHEEDNEQQEQQDQQQDGPVSQDDNQQQDHQQQQQQQEPTDITNAAKEPVDVETDTEDADSSNQLTVDAFKAVRDFIWGLFQYFVDPMLLWVRRHGKGAIPSVDISLVTSLTVLLESFAHHK